MIRFLLDANLSPQTAKFLRSLGFDTKSITEEKLGYFTDQEVVKLAKRQKRIIITFDLDFGEIYHEKEKSEVGIVVLRIKDQTVESANRTLTMFLEKYQQRLEKNPTVLVVAKKDSTRFVA